MRLNGKPLAFSRNLLHLNANPIAIKPKRLRLNAIKINFSTELASMSFRTSAPILSKTLQSDVMILA